MKSKLAVFALSAILSQSAVAANSLSVEFDLLIEDANQKTMAELAPVFNTIIVSGSTIPHQQDPNVQCSIAFNKFDSEKTYTGRKLPENTIRVVGTFDCVDENDTMAPAVLWQKMRKWIRADLSNTTDYSLHFISPIGPSVSGSN